MGTGFSFEVVNAEDYDSLRPDYAPEAVAWVVEQGRLGEGSLVVDLAAGTGQLSRRLALHDVDVAAVEPARNMLNMLAERLPMVRALAGTAEAIPLGDAEAHAVVVGNAFHHFDRDAAFADIRRVLRPGGALALFWAWPLEEEDLVYPGMHKIDVVVERARRSSAIFTAYRSWSEPPSRAEGFSPFERRGFATTHIIESSRLADLYATSSDVACLPVSTRADLLARIRDLARDLPESLHLPGRSVVDLCFAFDRVAR